MPIYDSGTLIWVDDDFEHDELMRPEGDIDIWQRIFGEADHRVYWLLNLNLEIATCAEDAKRIVEELSHRRNASSMVMGVLDMRIPKQVGGYPEQKFGIDTAVRFKQLDVPFTFLSSMAEPQGHLLRSRGLEGSDYSNKRPAPNNTMMPPDLARRVLSRFKSSITWINIKPLLDNWSRNPSFNAPFDFSSRSTGVHKAAYSFPFFSSAREFVERWEARQVALRRMRLPSIVLRAPNDHSDQFIGQCLSIILAGQDPEAEQKVLYVHANNPSARSALETASEDVVRVIRLKGQEDDIHSEVDLLRHVLRHKGREQAIFILPLDEKSDPFLDLLANETDVIFDDLPAVQVVDYDEREALVRRILQYHLQNLEITLDGGQLGYVADFYIDNPETIVHPLYWNFLLESEDIASDLTDPYEMQCAIIDALDIVATWSSADREKLVRGKAISPDLLLRPAREIFDRAKDSYSKWAENAFRDWLAKSWQNPYGCIDHRKTALSKPELIEWEYLSLLMASELAETYVRAAGPSLMQENPNLSLAARFLRTATVQQLIAGETQNTDWLELEALRWPHASYPMPAALNSILKKEGRYLFLQTDRLDKAVLTRKGTNFLLRLEDYAEMQEDKLQSIARNARYLPAGWRQSVDILYQALQEGQFSIQQSGDFILDPKIWAAMHGFAMNMTRVSFMFHKLTAKGPLSAADRNFMIGKTANDRVGDGKLLGVIRGNRNFAMRTVLRPSLPKSRNVLNDLTRLSAMSRSLRTFAEEEEHNLFDELSLASQTMLDAFASFEMNTSEMISGAEMETELRMAEDALRDKIFSSDGRLQSNQFFQNDFAFPDHMATQPVAASALRGTRFDLLLWFYEIGDLAFWTARQMQYSDGYHFLAITRDLRNGMKDGASPTVSSELISTVMDLFIYGFDGLLQQFKYCLHAAGHSAQAQKINPIDMPDFVPPEPDPVCAEIMQINADDGDSYQLFLNAYSGEARRKHGYFDHTKTFITKGG